MGQAKRRKAAGTYPEQTDRVRVPFKGQELATEPQPYTAVLTELTGQKREGTWLFTFPNEQESGATYDAFYKYVTEAVFPALAKTVGVEPAPGVLVKFVVTDKDGRLMPGTMIPELK